MVFKDVSLIFGTILLAHAGVLEPQPKVDFTSAEGDRLLKESLESGYGKPFRKVMASYRSQEERTFCGLSSITFALNILDMDPLYRIPWSFKEEQIAACPSLQTVRYMGLTLTEFSCLAAMNGFDVDKVHAQTSEQMSDFRQLVKHYTSSDDYKSSVLALNYNRAFVTVGGGHISPVAAYHQGTDRVLLADVNRSKYEPQWIYLPTLWQAMNSVDSVSAISRGYAIFRVRTRHQPLLITQLLMTAKNEPVLFKETIKMWVQQGGNSFGSLSRQLVNLFGKFHMCCTEKDFCSNKKTDDLVGRLEKDVTKRFCPQLKHTKTYQSIKANNSHVDDNIITLLSSLVFGISNDDLPTVVADVVQEDLQKSKPEFRDFISLFRSELAKVL